MRARESIHMLFDVHDPKTLALKVGEFKTVVIDGGGHTGESPETDS